MTEQTNSWYSRPVFFVGDVERSLAFYIERLGFSECWRHEDGETLVAAQVERNDLEVILNRDSEKAGKSRVFMSLDRGQVRQAMGEFQSGGAEVSSSHWGMPVMCVADPDGNELYFFDDELTEE